MDLINVRVKHKMFGEGTIIAHDQPYITIKFPKGEKKFIFPNAFEGFLTALDNTVDEHIKQELDAMKQAEEAAKEAAAEKERQARVEAKKEAAKEDDSGNSQTKKASKSKSKLPPRSNVAFKCNYCDGGRSDKQIGFNGVCSDEIIQNNIKVEKRSWCSSEECLCNKYFEEGITRQELDAEHDKGNFICYESQMLRDWKAYAGVVQKGQRKGQPMKLNQVQNNSLCVLTTRDPDSTERERYIFAVFLVDETYEGDNSDEGYVTTKSKYRIQFTPEEAHKLLFWNYHANKNSPEVAVWSSGLHRYFDDEQAIQLLQDIKELKKGTEDEELASEFLAYFVESNNIDIDSVPEKKGALLLDKP
jgi:hypothetical protein